jgi:hypothetical protein
MADWDTAYNWMMDNEDPQRAGHSVSGQTGCLLPGNCCRRPRQGGLPGRVDCPRPEVAREQLN